MTTAAIFDTSTLPIMESSESLKCRLREPGSCPKCSRAFKSYKWCPPCEAKRFRRNFQYWTSDNPDVDKTIQETQLKANNYTEYVEWIPWGQFTEIKEIATGGFSKVFSAVWSQGPRRSWDSTKEKWERRPEQIVALKSLNDSEKISKEFLDEISTQYKCKGTFVEKLYGITQDPETKNFVLVMYIATDGNLRHFLNKNYSKLDWSSRLANLATIADGLYSFHRMEVPHCNLHPGNILQVGNMITLISDFCARGPAGDRVKNGIYGVIPYVAPEVLRGHKPNEEADIYSFGMIMYEVLCGNPPFHDRAHDSFLVLDVIRGTRPAIPKSTPHRFVKLLRECWAPDPKDRPNAEYLTLTLDLWWDKLSKKRTSKTAIDFFTAEIECNAKEPPYTPPEIHKDAVYTSRLLNDFTRYLTPELEAALLAAAKESDVNM